MESKVPGIKAAHAIISTACREGRGDVGAYDEAAARLRSEYEKLLKHWPREKGAKFHIALTVEYQCDDPGRPVPPHGSGPAHPYRSD